MRLSAQTPHFRNPRVMGTPDGSKQNRQQHFTLLKGAAVLVVEKSYHQPEGNGRAELRYEMTPILCGVKWDMDVFRSAETTLKQSVRTYRTTPAILGIFQQWGKIMGIEQWDPTHDKGLATAIQNDLALSYSQPNLLKFPISCVGIIKLVSTYQPDRNSVTRGMRNDIAFYPIRQARGGSLRVIKQGVETILGKSTSFTFSTITNL